MVAYTHRLLHPLPADRPVRRDHDPRSDRRPGQDQTILAAWEIMLAQNLKALPVVDAQDHVVGAGYSRGFIGTGRVERPPGRGPPPG